MYISEINRALIMFIEEQLLFFFFWINLVLISCKNFVYIYPLVDKVPFQMSNGKYRFVITVPHTTTLPLMNPILVCIKMMMYLSVFCHQHLLMLNWNSSENRTVSCCNVDQVSGALADVSNAV
jgi:hypothetical protein